MARHLNIGALCLLFEEADFTKAMTLHKITVAISQRRQRREASGVGSSKSTKV